MFLGKSLLCPDLYREIVPLFYYFLSRAVMGKHSFRFCPIWDICKINTYCQCCKWRICVSLHVPFLPASFRLWQVWSYQEIWCLSDLVYMRAAPLLDIQRLSFLQLQSCLEAAFWCFGSTVPKSYFSYFIQIIIVRGTDYKDLSSYLTKC